MQGDAVSTGWIWANLAFAVVFLAAYAIARLHESGFYPLRDITRLIRRPWFEVALILSLIGGLIQYGATKGTNGADQAGLSVRSAPTLSLRGEGSADGAVECARPLTNLSVVGILPLSNSVCLSVSWPTSLFCDGTTLDFFVKIGALTNDWNWIVAADTLAGSTNLDVDIPYPSGVQVPESIFLTVRDRATCAATMADSDHDGIPDVYEFHLGTNPYVPDSESIPRLTVGSDGDYATVEAALAESVPYSVVSLSGETFESSRRIVMPPHPVLLEGPRTGYAVLRSSAQIGAVMLSDGQDAWTLFRNLIVDLRATDGFQAGFWLGGGVPWAGRGSAATFENVRIRAMYPGVEHFGWVFYCDGAGASRLTGCVMNAAGSTWAIGISAFNAGFVATENCAFLNMPNPGGEPSIAVLVRESTNVVVHCEGPVPRQGLSWAGYPLAVFYDRVADADGDGIPDHDEVFTFDTDPWLADSDGDGIDDGDEMLDGTNPKDCTSHTYEFDISVTNRVVYANTTNYVFQGAIEGWRTNLLFACTGVGFRTNVLTNDLFGAGRIGAFRDLDRNGVFEPEHDILLTKEVTGVHAVKRVHFEFGDVDGDGVDDVDERADGTDPYSKLSLKIARMVEIVNKDPTDGITNYWFFGSSQDMASAVWIPATEPTAAMVSGIATDGKLHVVVYRDFNRNGIYDEGIDAVSKWGVAQGTGVLKLTVGDADRDGVEDGQEIADGMDPLDGRMYCYEPRVLLSDVPHAERLMCNAFFGTNEILSAFVPTNGRFSVDFGHLATTNGGVVVLWFWFDANTNLVRDAEECCSSLTIRPNGHETSYVGDFPASSFDRDNDGLYDWWEAETGLAALPERHADYDDSDHDGLVNLHECWAGTDPLTPDGSNTLLSVCARSVDDRIRGIEDPSDVVDRFVNFHANARNGLFVANTNFWVRDLDVGCVSVWHGSLTSGNGGKSATAITRRHVVMAQHWYDSKYVFCDTNGVSYVRTIAGEYQVPGTDLLLGRLNADLPAAITIPKILPADYSAHLFTGKYLPVVCVTDDKSASITELTALNSLSSGYRNLGSTASTNHVSAARSRIRFATIEGNSGSPVFLLVGNRLVFLFSKHLGASVPGARPCYWGPLASHHLEEIQGKINTWEGADANRYQLDFLSLESFDRVEKNE